MTNSELKSLLERAADAIDADVETRDGERARILDELRAAAGDIPAYDEDIEDTVVIPAPLGKEERTGRGFQRISFKDHYDEPCYLQQSSIALLAQPGAGAVWLGLDGVKAMVMCSKAREVGLSPTSDVGWMPFPIPEQVQVTTQMHLDRGQVLSLVTTLQGWLATGYLFQDSESHDG